MKKVLVIGMTANPGGIESVVMNYYNYIDKDKVQFDFLCNTGTIAHQDVIKKFGGNIIYMPSRSASFFKYKREIKKFFKNYSKNYDAIWVNFCNITNLDYLKLSKKYGIKKRIIHAHNSQNMHSKLVEIMHKFNSKRIHKYATDYWSCSDDASNWFFGTNKKIDKKRIIIVNNAIDLEKFKYDKVIADKCRKELGIDKNFVVGHVGRFHFQKNQLFLLDVFKRVYEEDKTAVLLLIGQGEDEEKIKEKINQLGLNNVVKLLGVRDDISTLMKVMDVFLFPSIFEGLGLVLVEAQAAGLPVVASSDNIPHEVKMSDNFRFVSLNDSLDKWKEEVMNFKNSKRECKNRLSENNYDIKKEAKKLQSFFERS